MSEWKECQLGEVMTLQRGHDLTYAQMQVGKIPVIGSNGIIGYHNKKTTNSPCVTIGRSGSIGNAFFYNCDCWAHNTVLYIKDFKNTIPKFAYYLLNSLDFTQYNAGSAVPTLNRNHIHPIKVNIPKPFEQKAIAEVLSSLDDKIDLLSSQNKTLEALASTYFRQWFIEEANDEWETTNLGSILSVIESGNRPKGGINPNLKCGIPSIGAESINGLGVFDFSKTKYISNEFYNNMNRGKVQSHDVLVYKDGAYVGKKGMFGDDFPFKEYAVNEHVFILRANEKANQAFLYFLLDEDELSQLNSNSAQPGLNQESMKSFEITLPPLDLIANFETTVKPMITKVFHNAKEIQTLQELRDTLLPKLISGEARVAI